MTSMRGTGYTSQGSAFDPLNQASKGPAPPLISKTEERYEQKYIQTEERYEQKYCTSSVLTSIFKLKIFFIAPGEHKQKYLTLKTDFSFLYTESNLHFFIQLHNTWLTQFSNLAFLDKLRNIVIKSEIFISTLNISFITYLSCCISNCNF